VGFTVIQQLRTDGSNQEQCYADPTNYYPVRLLLVGFECFAACCCVSFAIDADANVV
jgi:hypothetical protein